MGFRDVGNWRAPNPMVKRKVMHYLGLV